ncbi:universal stress protein PHOS34-like [Prosopis cineraria]|uniref:universal stress protein PHOS34-like n=1 Tax=Prosopis cineraria TaxID=364024 RepID=UPI0024101C40|nr:universal stress protein PHOS34-like [Prosopis cineraria]
MEKTRKPLMMVAIDESEHSFYALEWALTNFFPSQISHYFQLMLVHAKPSTSSLVEIKGMRLTFVKNLEAEFVSILGEDLESMADKTIQKAKEICGRKSVENVITKVLEGDVRNVLCEAADKFDATILVLVSHGYGAVKRVVLGSVSDYCVQHAQCSVMVVKRPKIKRISSSSRLHRNSVQ